MLKGPKSRPVARETGELQRSMMTEQLRIDSQLVAGEPSTQKVGKIETGLAKVKMAKECNQDMLQYGILCLLPHIFSCITG